jgi:lysophospholipase L1-like esterase
MAKGETGSGSSASTQAPRVALIGDSLAQGLGAPLVALATFPFRAVGRSSTHVRDWLRDGALDEAMSVPPPELVLVCLGTNDMRAADPASAGTAGGALIDRIAATGAAVAWIGPPRMFFDNGSFRTALARECGARAVRIFDSQALDLERAADGIHLTPRSYRAWAEAIAAWVPFSAYAARSTASGAPAAAAPALLTLRTQLDERWPRRLRASDGIAPSEEHRRANPTSEHAAGNAIDITHDPEHGPDLGALAEALLKDRRTHYVIWRRRIANVQKEGGAWRSYTGASPHEDHLHLSILANRREDASPWELAGDAGDAPTGQAPATRMPAALYVDGFGVLGLEDYVARVVTAELGAARQHQALAAQAMAARSYVVWMAAHQGYGTQAKPVPNSQRFQVCARTATSLCIQATAATRGGLVLHDGRVVLTSYVAGALWPSGASTGRNGADPSKTEHAVTYNEGLVGAAVKPTPNAGNIADNRGCLSQNGAVELGRRGYLWPQILRYFYGADIAFTCPDPSTRPAEPPRRPAAPRPASPRPASPPAAPPASRSSQDGGPLLIAAAVAAYRIFT